MREIAIRRAFLDIKKPLGWLGLAEKGVITQLRSKMKNKKVIVGYVIIIY